MNQSIYLLSALRNDHTPIKEYQEEITFDCSCIFLILVLIFFFLLMLLTTIKIFLIMDGNHVTAFRTPVAGILQ